MFLQNSVGLFSFKVGTVAAQVHEAVLDEVYAALISYGRQYLVRSYD
jgi:hypothetical protein